MLSMIFAREAWHRLQAACIKSVGMAQKCGILCSENSRRIESLRNIYAGNRCFLIGNGSSLKERDLDRIAGEKSFACNLIYKIYDRTVWRPTYYCISDPDMVSRYSCEIAEYVDSPIFTNHYQAVRWNGNREKLLVLRGLLSGPYEVSDDLAMYYRPSKATIMTMMMELAMYMGFTTIYLLGVDGTDSLCRNAHFSNDYFTCEYMKEKIESLETAENAGQYYVQKAESAYKVILSYARQKGISIKNASRVKKLTVFPFQEFDDIEGLIQEEKQWL